MSASLLLQNFGLQNSSYELSLPSWRWLTYVNLKDVEVGVDLESVRVAMYVRALSVA